MKIEDRYSIENSTKRSILYIMLLHFSNVCINSGVFRCA